MQYRCNFEDQDQVKHKAHEVQGEEDKKTTKHSFNLSLKLYD